MAEHSHTVYRLYLSLHRDDVISPVGLWLIYYRAVFDLHWTYERRSINKLQNGVIFLIFKIWKIQICFVANSVWRTCLLVPIHQRALILFTQTLALYKSFIFILSTCCEFYYDDVIIVTLLVLRRRSVCAIFCPGSDFALQFSFALICHWFWQESIQPALLNFSQKSLTSPRLGNWVRAWKLFMWHVYELGMFALYEKMQTKREIWLAEAIEKAFVRVVFRLCLLLFTLHSLSISEFSTPCLVLCYCTR